MADTTPNEPGCSDGGCCLRDNSKRMHTNGGCSCLRGLAPDVRVVVRRRLAEWLLATTWEPSL